MQFIHRLAYLVPAFSLQAMLAAAVPEPSSTASAASATFTDVKLQWYDEDGMYAYDVSIRIPNQLIASLAGMALAAQS